MAKKPAAPLHELYTRWGRALDPDAPLPEYPRPQLARRSWQSLNGRWDYKICKFPAGSEAVPELFDGEIIVPFSPESLLSGVNRQLLPGQVLWYHRLVDFDVRESGCVLLHFGAVDQRCTVFVNGKQAGAHNGGYLPFSFDITALLHTAENGKSAANTVAVRVTDDSDIGDEAWGKQKLCRGGIWYTAQSGIWQTVWAETVPQRHIAALKITPLFDESAVEFTVALSTEGGGAAAHIEIRDGETIVAEADAGGAPVCVPLPGFKPWSPDAPFLYGVRVTLDEDEDEVGSYFGMRKFGVVRDANGHWRLALNDVPVFHTGLLDQGYWSDGLYTPPSDEAMAWEISEVKALGFNVLRKHIKIEPMRWYYHCDRLGMLVWQDMVSGGGPYSPWVIQVAPYIGLRLDDARHKRFGRCSTPGRVRFAEDMEATVAALYNCVGLCAWTVFNEGWGQFDALAMERELKKLDNTRYVDHASGWHDQGGGTFCSKHIYYKRYRMKPDKSGRVQALTEFGGYSGPTAGHMASDKLFGYKMFATKEALSAAVKKLYEREVLPAAANGLAAAIYTQVSDVEDEINGLFTYDRAEAKMDADMWRDVNGRLKGTVSGGGGSEAAAK